jgi:hypothetical protein
MEGEASNEFREVQASVEELTVQLHARGGNWSTIHDCIMTQVCNDRPLPPDVSFFTLQIIRELVKHATWQRTFHYLYQNASYSKLAMGPMWAELMDALQTTPCTHHHVRLYSGHDDTLMPLLATLGGTVWDGKWTPYASMLIFEVNTERRMNGLFYIAKNVSHHICVSIVARLLCILCI